MDNKDLKKLKERAEENQEPTYRYIKSIILFLFLGIVCFFIGMIRLGFILIAFAAGYAFFSYIQRYKTVVSSEEFIYKAAKNSLRHNKKSKKEMKEEKALRKSEYEQRLKEIEEEFDFDYDIGKKQELVCEQCGNKAKIVPKKNKSPECPVCGGKLIPIASATDMQNEDGDEDYDI